MTRAILALSLVILTTPVHAPAIPRARVPHSQPPKLMIVFMALAQASHEAGIPLWLAFSVAYNESSFRANCITSRNGKVIARGFMQISKQYQDELVIKYLGWDPRNFDWSNPVHSAKLGCRYLSSLVRRFSLFKGVAAYNCGAGRVNEWPMHRSLPDETWEYCHRVLG